MVGNVGGAAGVQWNVTHPGKEGGGFGEEGSTFSVQPRESPTRHPFAYLLAQPPPVAPIFWVVLSPPFTVPSTTPFPPRFPPFLWKVRTKVDPFRILFISSFSFFVRAKMDTKRG